MYGSYVPHEDDRLDADLWKLHVYDKLYVFYVWQVVYDRFCAILLHAVISCMVLFEVV